MITIQDNKIIISLSIEGEAAAKAIQAKWQTQQLKNEIQTLIDNLDTEGLDITAENVKSKLEALPIGQRLSIEYIDENWIFDTNQFETNGTTVSVKQSFIESLGYDDSVISQAIQNIESALEHKAPLVEGKVPQDNLPEAPVDKNHFELDEAGTLKIKTSYVNQLIVNYLNSLSGYIGEGNKVLNDKLEWIENQQDSVEFAILNTLKLNFTNNFLTAPIATFNNINVSVTAIQIDGANGYQSDFLVNIVGIGTPIRVSIPHRFTGIDTTLPTTGNNSGVVPDAVLASGFANTSTTNDGGILITGLNDSHFYQLYVLGNSVSSNSNVRFYVGDTFVNKMISSNFGSSLNNLEAPAWAVLSNIRSANGQILLRHKKLSGGWETNINALAIQVTNIAK